MTTFYLASTLALILTFAASGVFAQESDEILSLPGWESAFPSKQFSGYLNVGLSKHMHYWMIESENDPSTDPVVLWFNGGPGCSSLDGMLYEHGPLHVDPSNYSKLVYFNYTWAKQATMVYLEAPVGVGFSYSDDPSDYVTNDDTTAADNLAAVEALFAKYPQYLSSDLFITGESYAGVYVPTLAEAIMKAEDAGSYRGAALKGFAVGNGCTGSEVGTCGHGAQATYFETSYLLGQGFVPKSLKDSINGACDWSGAADNSGVPPLSPQCDKLIAKMHATLGNINIYNVYGDCISGSAAEVEGRTTLFAPRAESPHWARLGPNKGPNACIDSRAAAAWINQPSVLAAIHVVPQPFEWSICGNQIRYTSTRPNLPRDSYPSLINRYRVLVYNGDWDACVPYTDNEAWTEGMGYPVKNAWHAWTYDFGQVGGYATEYDTATGFTFVTVRGGRHEVPETQPERALALLNAFIKGSGYGAHL